MDFRDFVPYCCWESGQKKFLLSGKNGLKGQKDLSPGQRPGKKGKLHDAPHRGKRVRFQSFAPVGRYLGVEYNTQGVALG